MEYISCTSLNQNLAMLSNSGVNINDSIQVKNHLNIYYNAQFSYFAYQQVISNCATFAGSYVLPRKGTEADFVESAYRFGFNGMEKDNDTYGEGNAYDFGARIYDSRLGRWLSLDPLMKKYTGYSPYCYTLNNPIYLIDIDGKEVKITGADAQVAFTALKTTTSLTLEMDPETKQITITGVPYGPLTASDQKLMEAIYDPNIKVKLITTKDDYFYNQSGEKQLMMIGGNDGSSIDKVPILVERTSDEAIAEGSENSKTELVDEVKEVIKTKQYINMGHSQATENAGISTQGTDVLHEVLESYIGGQKAPGKDGSAAFDASHDEAMSLDPKARSIQQVKDPHRPGHIIAGGTTDKGEKVNVTLYKTK